MSLEPEAATLLDNVKTRQRSKKYNGRPLNSQSLKTILNTQSLTAGVQQ